MGKKRKFEDQDETEVDPPPKHLEVGQVKNNEKRLIVVLDGAQLETVNVSNRTFLNTSDDDFR